MKWFNNYSKNIFIISIAAISAAFISVVLVGFLHFSGEEVNSPDIFDASIAPVKLPSTQNVVFAEASSNPDYFPIRNWSVAEPEVDSKAALVIIPAKGKILFRKNIDAKLPIASITKIMTATVLLSETEFDILKEDGALGLEEEVMIKYGHVMTEGESGNLVVGEKLSLGDLFKIMMITSSNDAAEAIAESIGEKLRRSNNLLKSPRDLFIEKMNKQAVDWGLSNTHFSSPTGLVDEDNFSTAWDLVGLIERITREYPLIWDVSKVAKLDVQDSTGWINHHLVTTNELLYKYDNIVGGKTGYTENAGECIVIIQKNPSGSVERIGNGDIIYVVLGSGDRFKDAGILMDWVSEAFLW